MNRQAPTGDVLFPLASNAHALLSGASANRVRARLKTASLLYENVFIEEGRLIVQAGPRAASAWRMLEDPSGMDWQTPRERGVEQAAGFSLALAVEDAPGQPAAGPYQQVLASPTSISWRPTFAPFRHELPAGCDWIHFGVADNRDAVLSAAGSQRRFPDDNNEALRRLQPVQFVRDRLVKNIHEDLAVGAAGGWDVSVDRIHADVIAARMVPDATPVPSGFALPILVPKVGSLQWEDVARIRRHRAIGDLRKALHEMEVAAAGATGPSDELETTLRHAYEQRLTRLAEAAEGVFGMGMLAIAELAFGSAAGYATLGLDLLGPLAGGGLSAATMMSIHLAKRRRHRRHRRWIGVLEAVRSAAES